MVITWVRLTEDFQGVINSKYTWWSLFSGQFHSLVCIYRTLFRRRTKPKHSISTVVRECYDIRFDPTRRVRVKRGWGRFRRNLVPTGCTVLQPVRPNRWRNWHDGHQMESKRIFVDDKITSINYSSIIHKPRYVKNNDFSPLLVCMCVFV